MVISVRTWATQQSFGFNCVSPPSPFNLPKLLLFCPEAQESYDSAMASDFKERPCWHLRIFCGLSLSSVPDFPDFCLTLRFISLTTLPNYFPLLAWTLYVLKQPDLIFSACLSISYFASECSWVWLCVLVLGQIGLAGQDPLQSQQFQIRKMQLLLILTLTQYRVQNTS
jgi:hypothetical protein